MTKAKANTISQEEQEYLAAKEAKKKSFNGPRMKQLAINADKVDKEGNKIPDDTWHIRNESGYVEKITFRPLAYRQKFIRMVQSGKAWKIDNESIMVDGFEPAYDIKGGVGCGRVIGNLPDNWTDEQKLDNYKKAGIYGFLFGLVTFPGKEPELVNFRCPPAKSGIVRNAISQKTLGENAKSMYRYDFTMSLHYPIDKETQKPSNRVSFDMIPDLSNPHNDFSEILPYIKEVDTFIEAHNASIMARREQMITNLKSHNTYKDVTAIAVDEFNDTIPF